MKDATQCSVYIDYKALIANVTTVVYGDRKLYIPMAACTASRACNQDILLSAGSANSVLVCRLIAKLADTCWHILACLSISWRLGQQWIIIIIIIIGRARPH